MGDALDAFDAVWQRAHATFGTGTPQTGEQFDKSTQLRGMQTTVHSAAPGGNWSGTASSAYGTANTSQGRALGGLADLDQQLRAAVDRSAEIVTKGRQGLDETRKWVQDMAAQVPAGRNRDMQMLPIASQGLKQVTDLLTSTVTQQNAVAGDIKALTTRYSTIKGDLPLSPKDDKDVKDLNKILGLGDDEDGKDKDKKDDPGKKPELNSANGKADGDVLKDGMHGLFPPGDFHDRLLDASTLTPQQLADLAAGKPVVVGADRMAYLYQISQSMNGMTPAQIKDMQSRLPADEQQALAQGMAIISNSNAKSGVPNTEGVTDATRGTFVPAAGSLVNLPDGVYHELTRNDRVENLPAKVIGTGTMVPAFDPGTTKLHGVGALQDISDVFKPGDGRYLNGSEAGKAMLEATSTYAAADIAHREALSNPHAAAPDLVSDQHGSSLPSALAGVAQVGGQDHVGMHELVTGSSGDKFLHNFTAEAWGKDSDKVGDAFRWMSQDPHNPMDSETANKVAHFLSDNRHALEHMPGGGSFGSVNGGLLQGMADGTRAYMAELAGGAGTGLFNSPGIEAFANKQQMSDMFAVFDQDHQAGTTANNAALQQKQFLELYAAEHGVHGNQIEVAQRLANAMTTGADDAKAAGLANHVWQVHEQDQKKGVAFDTGFNSLTAVTGLVPGGGPIAQAVETVLGPTLKDQMIHETDPTTIQGDSYFTNQMNSGQFNSTASNYAVALQGLINTHPEIAQDPSLAWAMKVDDHGNHVVDLGSVQKNWSTADKNLTDWFRNNSEKYGYDKDEWTSQRRDASNDNWR